MNEKEGIYSKRVVNRKITKKLANDVRELAIDRASKKTGVTEREINKIFTAIQDCLTKHITSYDERPFRITYLGAFRVKPFRKWVLNNKDAHKKYKGLGILVSEFPRIKELGEGLIRVEYKDHLALIHENLLEMFIREINDIEKQ